MQFILNLLIGLLAGAITYHVTGWFLPAPIPTLIALIVVVVVTLNRPVDRFTQQ